MAKAKKSKKKTAKKATRKTTRKTTKRTSKKRGKSNSKFAKCAREARKKHPGTSDAAKKKQWKSIKSCTA